MRYKETHGIEDVGKCFSGLKLLLNFQETEQKNRSNKASYISLTWANYLDLDL